MSKGSKAVQSTMKTDGSTVFLSNGPTDEPADATLSNGELLIWCDEDTDKLKIKLKYKSGTVKYHELSLS